MQHLRKLSATSIEAREMLKYLNNMQNLMPHNQKKFYSSSSHSSTSGESKDVLSLNNENGNENISSFEDNKNKSSYDLNLFLFTNIINILENEPINSDTQLKIERFLYVQFDEFLTNKESFLVSDIDTKIFTGKFNHYCMDKVNELSVYIRKRRNALNSSKKLVKEMGELSVNQINNYLLKNILNKVEIKDIINIMLYILFRVATYNNLVNENDMDNIDTGKVKTAVLYNTLDTGKRVVNIYIRTLYKEHLNSNDHISYIEFKENLLSEGLNNKLTSSEFHLEIGGYIIELMKSCDMLNIEVRTVDSLSLSILTLNSEIASLLDNNVNRAISIPLNLPMIVKPKPYSKEEFGGYLLNGVEYDEPLITPKIGYGVPSKVLSDNVLYFVINKMMETPFKINKELLNYLLNHNDKHKLLIDNDYKHELSNIKRNKYQEREYQQFISKKLLEEYIIKIAKTYSYVPEIYFPIKLDNRGRLYPKTAFFSYQGSELAKALILFAKPDTLNRTDKEAIEYLKAYGATCFGMGLNKKSYTKRLEWVNDN
jgi:hypothetical protein